MGRGPILCAARPGPAASKPVSGGTVAASVTMAPGSPSTSIAARPWLRMMLAVPVAGPHRTPPLARSSNPALAGRFRGARVCISCHEVIAVRWGFAGKPRIRDDPEVIMRLLLVHPSAHVYSEAIDAEGLEVYRKRVSPDDNFRAPEAARGQANFPRMLSRFNKVHNGGRRYLGHHRPAQGPSCRCRPRSATPAKEGTGQGSSKPVNGMVRRRDSGV